MEPPAINNYRISGWCFVLLPAFLKRDQEWLGGFREGGGVNGSGEGKVVDSFDTVLYCSSIVFNVSGTLLLSLSIFMSISRNFELKRIVATLPSMCTTPYILYSELYLSSFER